MKIVYIDFETKSMVELRGSKSVGLYNYATHPSTKALMLAWAIDEGEVRIWFCETEPMPEGLREALNNEKVQIVAFNSGFERAIFQHVLGVTLPASRFQDPQASARYLSLPADLEEVSMVLGLSRDYAKESDGKRLIGIFCKPWKHKKKRGEEAQYYFRDAVTDPEEWVKFVEYCKQDVVAEREIMRRLMLLGVMPLPAKERATWIFDQTVNERGMPVDVEFVRKAFKLADRAKKDAIAEQNRLTGLENANSNTQLLPWVQERGYKPTSLGKEHVKAELEFNPELTDLCKEVLINRKAASSTSYKKLETLMRQVSPDERVRNLFTFMGSSRCGRWSSNALQFHNMARPDERFEDEENINKARAMVYAEDYDGIEQTFGKPTATKRDPGAVLLVIKSLIRTVFVAKKDMEFAVADENAIETRVAAWVSGCGPLLKVFELNRDPYLDFAVKMTQIPYENLYHDLKISKDPIVKARAKKYRQEAKPGVLGCFGPRTKVLTLHGWTPIIDIQLSDYLFDGINWVRHQGLLDKGIQNVISLMGVEVTPNHEILVGESEWKTAWDVYQNTQLEKQALDLATGLLLQANIKVNRGTIISVAAGVAEKNSLYANKTSNEKKLAHVINVLLKSFKKRKTAFMYAIHSTQEKLSTVLQTYIMRLFQGVKEWAAQVIDMGVGGLSVDFLPSTLLLSTFSYYPILITPNINLIDETIMDTMRKETFVSFPPLSTTEIKKQTAILSITERNIAPRIFGKNSLHDIGMLEMLPEQSVKDYPQNKSLRASQSAEVRTYDILNSGPRNRFMILTENGPLIVHNCVYRLGGGQIGYEDGVPVKQGYWGYAANMGVNITQEQAHETVRVFRESYKEIVEFWYLLEKAVADVLEEGTVNVKREVGPNSCIKIDKLRIQGRHPILRIQLPSGRYLSYMDARIESTLMPWKTKDPETGEQTVHVYKPTLVYAGQDQKTHQWGLVTSHGGKIFENIVQGIARDVLAHVMLICENERDIPVVGHVHDEIISEKEDSPFAPGLMEMEWLMAQEIPWAQGLPLKGDGFAGAYYHK